VATTTDKKITRADSNKGSAPVAASKLLPQNGMVFRDASGYATDIIAAGANPFLGIAECKADNSSGANGAIDVELWQEGKFLLGFTGSTLTQADIGKKVYATDNDVCHLTSTSRTYIGTLAEFVSATSAFVQLDVQLP